MVQNTVHPDMMQIPVWVVIPTETAARKQGGRFSFQALEDYGRNRNPDFFNRFSMMRLRSFMTELTTEDITARHIKTVYQIQESVCDTIYGLRQKQQFPLIISGDHSSVAGISAGLKKAHPNDTLGIVYIDAHADLHTPFTTPSGNIHGMPLAAVCGLDNREMSINQPSEQTKGYWEKLKNLAGQAGIIKPEHIVFCAVRDCEEAELETMRNGHISNFTVAYLRKHGPQKTAEHILSKLKNCERIYVSFDIDSLDPKEAPGTGTPVVNGLTRQEATELNCALIRDKRVCCWELTELNPVLDHNCVTTGNAFSILYAVTEELLIHY